MSNQEKIQQAGLLVVDTAGFTGFIGFSWFVGFNWLSRFYPPGSGNRKTEIGIEKPGLKLKNQKHKTGYAHKDARRQKNEMHCLWRQNASG